MINCRKMFLPLLTLGLLGAPCLVIAQPATTYYTGCWGGCYGINSTGITAELTRGRVAYKYTIAEGNGFNQASYDHYYDGAKIFAITCGVGHKVFDSGDPQTGGAVCEVPESVASAEESKDPDECEGNPCNVVSGRKTQTETDLTFGPLSFNRYYDSGSPDAGTIMGARWRHSFEPRMNNLPLLNSDGDYAISPQIMIPPPVIQSSPYKGANNACVQGWEDIKSEYRGGSHATGTTASYTDGYCKLSSGGTQIGVLSITPVDGDRIRIPNAWGTTNVNVQTVTTPTGGYYTFQDTSPGLFEEASGYPVRLELDATNDQWLFYENNTIDRFDDGALIARTVVGGRTLTLNYGPVSGLLDSVSDDEGNSISFTYNTDGHITQLTHPDGDIDYAYDTSHNLISVTYEDGKVRQYHYEDTRFPNHLTGITDERGLRYATWTYDAKGRATTSEHGTNGADLVTLVYNASSTVVTDAAGGVRTYQIDTAGSRPVVTGVTGDKCLDCGRGGMKSRTQDATGYMNEVTDWEGNITDYDYDNRGLETQRIEAKGTALQRTITTEWHPVHRLHTKIIEPERTTQMTYDTTGRLLQRKVTHPSVSSEQTTVFTYHSSGNGAGRIASVDGPRFGTADTTTYGYDASHNLSSVTNPLGNVTQISNYTPRRLPGTVFDVNGVETTLSYHARGWLETIVVEHPGSSALDASTTMVYDDVGQITRMTLPDGAYLDYEYDDAQRLDGIENQSGERIEYTLDASGNITLEVIKNSTGGIVKTKSRVFDQMTRLIKDIGANLQETEYGYDNNDNTSSIEDGRNNTTSFGFDALQRLVSQTDPDNYNVTYTYDTQDRIHTVTDQRGLVTTYTYDAFDNLISLQSPDTGTTAFTYDDAGNRLQKTDARSVVTNYTYDDLDRLLTVSFPAAPAENVTYTYDNMANSNYGKGRLTGITDQSGHIDYTYDHRGNVIQKSYAIETTSYAIDYGYDVADNLVQAVYPSGRIVDYTQDSEGRTSGITTKENTGASIETVVSSVSYLPFGPVSDYTYGNGLIQTLAYDDDYRIDTIEASDSSTTVLDLDLAYDANSNITTLDDLDTPANDQAFQYDPLNRLTQATGNYGQLDYQYDGVGNRTQKTTLDGGTVTETYTYDPNKNQLDLVVIDYGSTQTQRSLGYDNVGNITLDAKPDGSFHDRTYNNANRYSELDLNAVSRAVYLYNALGQRTLKAAVGGNKSIDDHYHYDESGMLLAVTTASGVVKREYIYLGTTKVASLIDTAYANEWDDLDTASGGNTAPTANAGADVFGLAGGTVQLDGLASFDAEGSITLLWTGPGLINATVAQPTVTSTDAGSNISLVYTLTVTDAEGLTATDTVNVTLYSMTQDSDSDFIPDGWEYTYFGGPGAYSSADDPDGDGISNLTEFLHDSDPTVAIQLYPGKVLDANPVSYWRLGEASGVVAADASTNGNDAAYSGTIGYAQTSLVEGASDTAAGFNGSNTYVDVGQHDFVQQTGVFTFEAWIQLTNVNANTAWSILSSAAGTADVGFWFAVENRTGVGDHALRLFIVKGTSGTPLYDGQVDGLITDNLPHHIVVTGDGSQVTFYVDGVAYPAPGSMGSLTSAVSTRVTNIGRGNHTSPILHFDGVIDELAIYSTTLTGQQVSDHFDASLLDTDLDAMPDPWELRYGLDPLDAGDASLDLDGDGLSNLTEFIQGSNPAVALLSYAGQVLDDSPVGYWRLGEASGTVAADATSHANDATFGGTIGYAQTSLVEGASDTAAGFNGSNTYVDLGHHDFVQQTGIFTFEAWIQMVDANANAVWSILSTESSTSKVGFWLGVENRTGVGSNALRLMIIKGVGGTPIYDGKVNGLITDSLPHHIVITGNGSHVTFYVDGVAHPGPGSMGSLTTSSSARPVNIGRSNNASPSSYFNGVIDELAIYSTTLTGQQVSDHFDASLLDTDLDTMPDPWELRYGLDPLDAGDASLDLDGDGLSNLTEFIQGSNPAVALLSYAGQVLDDSPVGYWRLGEASGTVAADATSHANDATFGGTIGYAQTSLVEGASDTAAGFNGSNTYVDLGHHDFVQQTGIFTFEAWIQMVDANANAVWSILSTESSTSKVGFWLGVENRTGVGSNALRLMIIKGVGGTPIYDGKVNGLITDSLPHHIVITGNGSHVTFYVDGVAHPGPGSMGSLTTSSSARPVNIGRSNNASPSSYFNGAIDEVAIYNTTLTAQEVSDHYAEGSN